MTQNISEKYISIFLVSVFLGVVVMIAEGPLCSTALASHLTGVPMLQITPCYGWISYCGCDESANCADFPFTFMCPCLICFGNERI